MLNRSPSCKRTGTVVDVASTGMKRTPVFAVRRDAFDTPVEGGSRPIVDLQLTLEVDSKPVDLRQAPQTHGVVEIGGNSDVLRLVCGLGQVLACLCEDRGG